MFTPLAMPEAAERGWVGYVPAKELPFFFSCMPFLRAKHAIVRHMVLAVVCASLWVPAGLGVLTQVLTPPYAAADLTIFSGVYVLTISVFVMPSGILGFCVEDNYHRTIEQMSMDPDKFKRLIQRLLWVPRV